MIEAGVRRKELVPVAVEGAGKVEHWVRPEAFETAPEPVDDLVHILSPFDPLIIQRKRLQLFFDYEHRFEAYLPKEKRLFGYLALPVLIGDAGRRRHRSQDRPRATASCRSSMDLGGARVRPVAQAADRGRNCTGSSASSCIELNASSSLPEGRGRPNT